MPPYSPHILKGMVFAMYDTLDMARAFHDAHARELTGHQIFETYSERFASEAANPPTTVTK